MDYQTGLKAIADNSAVLINWALAVAGGSIATIVGTSHERPKTEDGRLIYLIFPIAWLFLGASIYAGEEISRRYIAALLDPEERNIRAALSGMNDAFVRQWTWLEVALILFSIWLLVYVCWFISGWDKKTNTASDRETSNTDQTT